MNDDWVPFSHRYGFAGFEDVAQWDGMGWRSRHNPEGGTYRAPELFRCLCPASDKKLARIRCLDRASQEDRLCDACREHCWAVDPAGHRHRLVDLYGATA